MRDMKKSVFSALVALMLCCLTVVSVSAIDTPWLPITPDGGGEQETTASTTVTTEEASEPSSEENSKPQNSEKETQPSQGDSVASSQPKETQGVSTPSADTNGTEPSNKPSKGCGSSVTGVCWIAVLSGAGMLCKKKRAEEKDVNG